MKMILLLCFRIVCAPCRMKEFRSETIPPPQFLYYDYYYHYYVCWTMLPMESFRFLNLLLATILMPMFSAFAAAEGGGMSAVKPLQGGKKKRVIVGVIVVCWCAHQIFDRNSRQQHSNHRGYDQYHCRCSYYLVVAF